MRKTLFALVFLLAVVVLTTLVTRAQATPGGRPRATSSTVTGR